MENVSNGDTILRSCGTGTDPEKNGKETPIWGVAQFGEMSHPDS